MFANAKLPLLPRAFSQHHPDTSNIITHAIKDLESLSTDWTQISVLASSQYLRAKLRVSLLLVHSSSSVSNCTMSGWVNGQADIRMQLTVIQPTEGEVNNAGQRSTTGSIDNSVQSRTRRLVFTCPHSLHTTDQHVATVQIAVLKPQSAFCHRQGQCGLTEDWQSCL